MRRLGRWLIPARAPRLSTLVRAPRGCAEPRSDIPRSHTGLPSGTEALTVRPAPLCTVPGCPSRATYTRHRVPWCTPHLADGAAIFDLEPIGGARG